MNAFSTYRRYRTAEAEANGQAIAWMIKRGLAVDVLDAADQLAGPQGEYIRRLVAEGAR